MGDAQEGESESELRVNLILLFPSRRNYQAGYSWPPKSQLKSRLFREIIRTMGEFWGFYFP